MLEKIYTVMHRIKWVIDWVVSTLCIWIVGAMVVLVTYQVISRYLFNSPSAISEVLSRYLFIWLILFAGAFVFGRREHMAIPYIKDKFPKKVGIVLDMFSELMIFLFALMVMIIGGYNIALRQMTQSDSALHIPMGVIYAAIPISGILIAFYFIYNEILLLRFFNQHLPAAPRQQQQREEA